jgi:hypothetical protein
MNSSPSNGRKTAVTAKSSLPVNPRSASATPGLLFASRPAAPLKSARVVVRASTPAVGSSRRLGSSSGREPPVPGSRLVSPVNTPFTSRRPVDAADENVRSRRRTTVAEDAVRLNEYHVWSGSPAAVLSARTVTA